MGETHCNFRRDLITPEHFCEAHAALNGSALPDSLVVLMVVSSWTEKKAGQTVGKVILNCLM